VIQQPSRPYPKAHFLIQPGWQNSGPHHWQTLWEERLGSAATRVQQQDWMVPERGSWVATLDASVRNTPAPVVILAHSVGCLATVFAMAAAPVAAAVLVAPADAEREGAPEALRSFIPIPREILHAPALLIASDNDPYCSVERARDFAQSWRADFEIVPGGGHINTDAGFGPWPEGWQMVGRWLRHHDLAWPDQATDGGGDQDA
jgi:predicted alpha/beta hydrolase family esterase